ncbi:MAG: SCO family protein [Planctomycetes bacterium]|nr:SCO family protein [Planctomycetota bacterium]
MNRLLASIGWIIGSAIAAAAARGQTPMETSRLLGSVGIDQRLDEQVPLDLAFRDEAGRRVTLRDAIGDQPAVLSLLYYRCPMLCTLEMNGIVRSLRALGLDVGRGFSVVHVSIDPSETPELAARKKATVLEQYGRAGAEAGWHFLTGEEVEIRKLAHAVGFRYVYDPATKQYAHAAGIMVVTPSGKLSRYFYGVEFSARDLRLGLVEASAGRIGSPVDQLLLLCFHYDPTTGKYGFVIVGALRLLAAATVIGLAALVTHFIRRDRSRASTSTQPSLGASR